MRVQDSQASGSARGAQITFRSWCRLWPLLGLGLLGCVQPSARSIVGPDGQPTLFVSCAETGQCYELAGRYCPTGYDIQRTPTATPESYLVRCRPTPAATPTYYDPRTASISAAPQAVAPDRWPPDSTGVDPLPPWGSGDQAPKAPPPPPPPPLAEAQTPDGLSGDLSIPQPIGAGEPDVGY